MKRTIFTLLVSIFSLSSTNTNAQCTAPTAVVATPAAMCTGATASLNATAAGAAIKWYTVPVGGSTVGATASGADYTITAATTTTYYAEALYPAASATLNYTGGMQSYTVPAGVTTLTVDIRGARGGTGYPGVSSGGKGGRVTGTISVTPGQVLQIYVGGTGGNASASVGGAAGFNGGGAGGLYAGSYGGGGGGGATDIRVSPYGLADRIAVAGGGGGGAYNSSTTDYDRGGYGNGPTGESGYSNGVSATGAGGYGGSASSGGTGGFWAGYCSGSTGSLGLGGNAGSCTNSGGGGGGGYFGGGGGVWAGGGGGGSFMTNGIYTGNFQVGNGLVIITTDCISPRVAVTVTVNPLPVITVSNGTICSGKVFTLSPSGAATYTYAGGSATVSPSSNSSYTITGTSAAGCLAQNVATANISVSSNPTVSVNSGSICSGNSFTILPSGADSYTFQGGSSIVNPLSNTTFTVAGTNTLTGCISQTATAGVTVYASPTISVNSATICSGSTVTLIPTGAGSGASYSITGASNFTVTPLSTTVYSVTGTTTNNCVSSNTAVATISVNTKPTISVNSATICSGNSATIIPTGAGTGATYTITGASNFTVAPLSTTAYSITGTATNNCVSSNTAVASVSVNTTPTITINSATICSGQSVTLIPSGAGTGGTYTLSGAPGYTVTPAITSSYSVTGTATNNCISSNIAVASVSVNTTPTISVNSATICSGESVTLTPSGAGAGASYSITGASNFTVTPLSTTAYSVTGTASNNCVSSNTAVATVSVNITPTISVNNATICSGNSVVIVPTGAGTGASYSITGAPDFTVTPLTTTIYSVTGTAGNNCISSNTAVATVSVNTTPTITVNSATICSGESVTLSPSGAGNGGTYTLSGATAYTVSPAVTSSYSFTGTSANNCVSDNVAVSTISVNASPTLTLSGNTTLCAGQTTTLTVSGAATFSWSNGATTPTISAGNGSYTVHGTTGICSSTAAIALLVNPLPTVSVNSGSVCAGQAFTIMPSGAGNYTYSSGTAVVTPSASSVFSVSGADANGCISQQALSHVTVNALPVITAVALHTTICIGETATLSASGANTYDWGGGQSGDLLSVTPSVSTVYTVTGTGAFGCVSSATVAQNTDPCTGLRQQAAELIRGIYPNPNTGEFVIEALADTELSIMNMQGQVIYSAKINDQATTIRMSYLASGIYFVKGVAKGQQQVVKMIKE